MTEQPNFEGLEKKIFALEESKTKLKRSVAELQKRIEKYRSMISSMSGIIFQIDENDVYIDVHCEKNREDLLYSPEEFLGRKVQDVMPSHIVPLYNENSKATRNTGKSHSCEYSIQYDKSEKWYSSIFDLHKDGKSLVVRTEDITERKNIEKALRESEDFLNRTGDMAQVGGWEVDLDTMKVVWTRTTGRIHELPDGYFPDLEEAISYYHPEDQDHVRQCVQLAIESSEPFDFTVRLITAKGRERWVRALGQPIFDSGSCVRLSGTFQDITEFKMSRDVLQRQLHFERGISAASKSLLSAQNSEYAVSDALTSLLEASRVSRVYIFENFDDPDDGLCMRQVFEVCAPGITSEIDNPVLQHVVYSQGFERWREALAAGIDIRGQVTDFPGDEREFLEPQGILSMLVLPLVVDGKWWGFIGFDENRRSRDWQDSEVTLLRMTAEMLGTYFMRRQVQERLERVAAELQLAQRISKVGNWFFDPMVGVPQWSDEVFRIYERDPTCGPIPLADYPKIYSPEQFEVFGSAISAAIVDGTPYNIELHLRLPSGSEKWINAICEPLPKKGAAGHCLLGTIQDITERKQAEDALRRSETLFQTMLAAIPDMISIHDTEMNVVYSNWNGFAAAPQDRRTLGEKCYRIYRGHDKVCPDCRAKQVLETRKPYAEEVELPEGGWVELNVLPILDADGNCELFVEWVRDITERKESEKGLQQSEEKFRALVDNTIDWIWQTDANGTYTYASQNTYEILGYTSEELLGRTPFDFMDNEEADRVRSIFIEIAQKHDRIIELEDTLLHKDGHSVIFETNATPLIDENSCLLGYFGTCRDITERKRAEKDLIRQKRSLDLHNRIATVFLTSPGGVVFADILDVILELLDSRYGYFGYIDEAGNLVCPSMTREVWDQCRVDKKSIVFPRADWGGLWGRSLMEKRTLVANENLHAPEGHVALENALATPIVHRDTLIGQFVVANKTGGYDKEDRDLLESAAVHTAPILFAIQEEARQKTAHEKLEVRLRQAQKMEAIGALAGGIAHDFNNLLFPIVGMSELLLEDIPSGTPEHENVLEILAAGKRGSELVKQILAFSRQSEDQKIPVRIQQVLKEVIKMVRATIPVNINITHHIKPDCGLVMADPTQVHQIAMNLITNAYHAVDPDNGNISVQLKEAVLESETLVGRDIEAGPYALLTVSDNGCGIAPGNIEKIFDPYFTTKEQGKGTGIGLSTVYGIVKEHGGDIQVYSELGKGTTFTIYLPLMVKVPDSISNNTAESSPSGSERILLVDDEDAIARLEKQILERLGYRVTSRVSSLEALEAFKADPESYDLVITDMSMPNMTGDRLARELVAIRSDVPVIVCTGFSERMNHEKAEAFGIKGFLMKPIVKSEMAHMIRRVLDEAKS